MTQIIHVHLLRTIIKDERSLPHDLYCNGGSRSWRQEAAELASLRLT